MFIRRLIEDLTFIILMFEFCVWRGFVFVESWFLKLLSNRLPVINEKSAKNIIIFGFSSWRRFFLEIIEYDFLLFVGKDDPSMFCHWFPFNTFLVPCTVLFRYIECWSLGGLMLCYWVDGGMCNIFMLLLMADFLCMDYLLAHNGVCKWYFGLA